MDSEMKKVLVCSWLFFVSLFCFVYFFFYTTSGRTPDWQYKTPLNFGEFSADSPAIIRNDILYFCSGSRMSGRIFLNAVRKDGIALWSTLIAGQCYKLDISKDEIHVLHQNSVGLKQPAYKKPVILSNGKILVISLDDGKILKTLSHQKYTPHFLGQIPEFELRHKTTKYLNADLLTPKHIIVTDKETGKRILNFGATGRIHGFIESSDSLFVYDDDGKLYMFKK